MNNKSESVYVENVEPSDEKLGLFNAAQESTDFQKKLNIWEAIKLYPYATLYSIAISSTIVMVGFDGSVSGY
jgi:hypothetical protein